MARKPNQLGAIVPEGVNTPALYTDAFCILKAIHFGAVPFRIQGPNHLKKPCYIRTDLLLS